MKSIYRVLRVEATLATVMYEESDSTVQEKYLTFVRSLGLQKQHKRLTVRQGTCTFASGP